MLTLRAGAVRRVLTTRKHAAVDAARVTPSVPKILVQYSSALQALHVRWVRWYHAAIIVRKDVVSIAAFI